MRENRLLHELPAVRTALVLAVGSLAACARSNSPTATVGDASAIDESSSNSPSLDAANLSPEAGFVDVPPRTVTLAGRSVTIGATARLFYNEWPAAREPQSAPIVFLSNGFTAETVRAFGTGPMTVDVSGAIVPNPTPLTALANLVYLEPRQAGYSYDVVDGRAPDPSLDCTSDIFNEYVDAADYLLGALAFLDAHPALQGPVLWLGESYAGVRVTWLIAYLRGRFDLANYGDPTLAAAIDKAAATRPLSSLAAGQILLEAWLAGGAHTAAIDAACIDPGETAAVAQSVPGGCGDAGACACADANGRSPYDFEYTLAQQTARENDASNAHILPDRAAALLGVALPSIAGLSQSERAAGFKCSQPNAADPNETLPDETPLVNALGDLPSGQFWYLNFSPLQPDTDTASWTRDWETQPFEGTAFVDNLHDVPAFVTDGALDLVVPFRALAPALTAIAGANRVDADGGALTVVYSDGERSPAIGHYPNAGHMITMLAPAALAADLAAWPPLQ